MYQLTKNIASDNAPHIYSALRDLRVIFEIYTLSSGPKLVDTDLAGTLDS